MTRSGVITLLLLALAVVAALAAWVFLTKALLGDEPDENTRSYTVPSEAMLPTIKAGEEIDVDEDAYDSDEPEVNDIVVFHPPTGAVTGKGCAVPRPPGQPCPAPTPEPAESLFVTRVVAGPGDRLGIEDGHPVVNGVRAEEGFVRECSPRAECDMPQEITILDGHYFMLGDNRGESDDSRFWGPVPLEWITGKVD